MNITDIPEYVEASPGDLIRSSDWNNVQRQTRNSLRMHKHTRLASAPVDDTVTQDNALQLTTVEIADGAVTGAKIAADTITSNNIAPNAVGSSEIAPGAVRLSELAFTTVKSGSATLTPGEEEEQLVDDNAPSIKTTIFFPTVATVSTTGSGYSEVNALIIYRQNVGANTSNVLIRLKNTGTATANVLWAVTTFAS
ncbi:MAG TPA: hypothetical protein VFR47_22725 [Anaerolineales bacterium]|nr:hypothetical protein [Anaerolineales bacterium]